MATGQRIDPYKNFRFLVEIDGIVQAGFSEATIPDSSQDPIEYREGNEPPTVRKIPGIIKYGNVTLKWGITDSLDLYNWRKYENNPIFSRGEPGTWDDGGIWFGTVHKHGDVYYMWYEGWGGGVKSRTAAYAPGGRSQIGLATLSSPGFGAIS